MRMPEMNSSECIQILSRIDGTNMNNSSARNMMPTYSQDPINNLLWRCKILSSITHWLPLNLNFKIIRLLKSIVVKCPLSWTIHVFLWWIWIHTHIRPPKCSNHSLSIKIFLYSLKYPCIMVLLILHLLLLLKSLHHWLNRCPYCSLKFCSRILC